MPADIVPLTYGAFYHIYNRGNNRDNIFIQERNYTYFLNLWSKHTSPIAETWAYCLLRNHFHAAVYIKRKEDLTSPVGDLVNPDGRVKKGSILSDPHGDLSSLKQNLGVY